MAITLRFLARATLIALIGWSVLLSNSSMIAAQVASDSDGDGLSNDVEISLGTNPYNIDTDCDGIDDYAEVGNFASPVDSDRDGLINARESSIIDSNLNGAADQTDSNLTVQLSCMRFSPFVLTDDRRDNARLEIRVEAQHTIKSVRIPPSTYNTTGLLLDGAAVPSNNDIVLYDNGTFGDHSAGDHVWTRAGFAAGSQTPPLGERQRKTFILSSIIIEDEDGIIHRFDLMNRPKLAPGIEVGVVSRNALQTVVQIQPGVQAVSHLANIIDPIVNLQVARETPDLTAAARRVYASFPDRFDFLSLYEDYDLFKTYSGIYYGVKNDVTGIGKRQFDRSLEYGSSGKLQGIIRFSFPSAPFAHEIMHRWGAPVLPGIGLNQCSANPPDAHWGVAGVGKGILGGYDPTSLVDNANGTYTVSLFFPQTNRAPIYNQLERYLAGIIPATEVQPIQIPINVDCSSLAYNFAQETVTFRASGLKSVTIAEVQQELGGERSPSANESQHTFSVGSIVFSERPLTEAEMAFFNVESQQQSDPSVTYSFAALTGGVGSVDTRLVEPSTDGVDVWVNAPAVVPIMPDAIAGIPIRYGNAGGAAAVSTSLTLRLAASFSYVSSTLGAAPDVTTANDMITIRWQLPTVSSAAQRSNIIYLNAPGAQIGERFDFQLSIDADDDALPDNNIQSGQIMVSTFTFLPVMQKQ